MVWMVLLLVLSSVVHVHAQGWSEPAIDGSVRSAPLTPPPVTGTTYYVDKNSLGGTCNNGNAGTVITAPKCSIASALSVVGAGGLVYVRAGTYTEGNLRPTTSGTAGNYITIRRYPGDAQPVLNCSGFTFCFDGQNSGAPAYVVWDGLEAHSPTQRYGNCQATAGCNHWWFLNGKYHDTQGDGGLEFYGAQHSVLSNNEIYGGAHAAGLNGNAVIFEFNTVHSMMRDGDDDAPFKCLTSWECVMRYNTVYDSWRDPTSSNPCFTPGSCQGIAGLYIDIGVDGDHGTRTYVYNNTVHGNDMGIEVWGSTNVSVFNNVIYNNGNTAGSGAFVGWYGIGLIVGRSDCNNIEVYNNTVLNSENEGLMYNNAPAGNIVSRNNIAMNNGGAELFANFGATNGDFDYDLLADTVHGGSLITWDFVGYNTLAQFQARSGNTTETHAVGTAATFVNAGTDDYRLSSGSAGLDVGATVTLANFDKNNVSRPQGSAYDLGAYELVVAGTAPTITRILR